MFAFRSSLNWYENIYGELSRIHCVCVCVCFASHPYMVDWIIGIIYRFHKLRLRQSVLQSDMFDMVVWTCWDAFDVRQTFPLNLVVFFFFRLLWHLLDWLPLSCMNSQWRVEQMEFHFIRSNNNLLLGQIFTEISSFKWNGQQK